MVSIITSIYTCSIDGIALFIQKTVSTRYATIFSVFPPITFCKKSMIQLLFHLKYHIYNMFFIRQTIIILIKPKTKKKKISFLVKWTWLAEPVIMIVLPCVQFTAWYPGSHPCIHIPVIWSHAVLLRQCPQLTLQFSP